MSQSTETRTTTEAPERGSAHQAGAFDIRTFIAMLIGIYGVVLIVTGIIGSNTNRDGHTSVNLWAGVAMAVVAVAFQVWAKKRPVVVPDEPADTDND
jgi:hypothetical protein